MPMLDAYRNNTVTNSRTVTAAVACALATETAALLDSAADVGTALPRTSERRVTVEGATATPTVEVAVTLAIVAAGVLVTGISPAVPALSGGVGADATADFTGTAADTCCSFGRTGTPGPASCTADFRRDVAAGSGGGANTSAGADAGVADVAGGTENPSGDTGPPKDDEGCV